MRAALLALVALAPVAAALPIPQLLPQPLAGQVAVPPATGTMLLPLPVGTFEVTRPSVGGCPAAHACFGFQVTCPTVQAPANGTMAVAEPLGPARGVLMFFSGGGGTGFELNQLLPDTSWPTQLRADGFRLVQVSWQRGWLGASPNEAAGFARLACRPATAIAWVYQELYAPLGLDPAPGACGFCITGNSGGSTQVGFALSHYGLDAILDAVVPTGGPPHALLHEVCLDGSVSTSYPDGTRQFIDEGWGFYDDQGPCYRRSQGWLLRFYEDSVAGGGSDYAHGATRVRLLVGTSDQGMVPNAQGYLERLQGAGSDATFEQVPGTPHFVLATPQGRAAVRAAFLE